MQIELHQLDLTYEKLRIWDSARQARLMTWLANNDRLTPVLVVNADYQSEPVRYVLIDGYRRVRALHALKRDTVEALVLPLSEIEALLFAYHLYKTKPRTALEEGWFLKELKETHKLGLSQLALQCRRSPSWISRRLGLVRVLPDSVQSAVRAGKICPHAAAKVFVPLARANIENCERLAVAAVSMGQLLSSRQWEKLYSLWKTSDHDARNHIIQNPQLALKVDEELSIPEPPEPEQTKSFFHDLEVLGAISRRIRSRLQGISSDELALFDWTLAANIWSCAKSDFDCLDHLLKECCDARSGNKSGNTTPKA